jgi:putative phage-type endonuclease
MTANKEDRSTGIGGSDAAAALGISPWKSRYQLWREKRGLDLQPEISHKPVVEWGTLLEDTVAAKFAEVAQLRVQRINRPLRSFSHPFMVANIDRAVVNPQIAKRVYWMGDRLSTDQILEAKTTSSFAADDWGDEGTDQIPLHYAAQAVHYLIVTGVAICHFGVLIDGSKFRRYKVERDRKLMDMVIDGEREFWRMVEENVEPEAVTLEDVKRKYRNSNEAEVEANDEIAAKVLQLREITFNMKADEKRAEALKLEIMRYMGDAAVLTSFGQPIVTWRKAKDSNALNQQLLKQEQPDIYAQYCGREGSRRFLLKGV